MLKTGKDNAQIILTLKLRNPQMTPYTPLFDCKDLHQPAPARISYLKSLGSYPGNGDGVNEILRAKRGAIITDADEPGCVTVIRKTWSIKPATGRYRKSRVAENVQPSQ